MLLAIGALGYQVVGPRLAAAGQSGPATVTAVLAADARAGAAVAELSRTYSGVSRSWREANALGAIIQYMQETGSRAYLADVTTTYQEHLRPGHFHGFLNGFYDDEGWWALTWVRAYDLTGNPAYLRTAKVIFANLTKGWSSVCGGGVRWNKRLPYKDAISNELFLQIAAQLHMRIPGDTRYARWALREWAWFRASGMIERSGLVADGLQPDCRPVQSGPAWTYNQGGLIGGLVYLSQMTGQPALLGIAEKTAGAVLHSKVLDPGGILNEPCPLVLTCGNDAPTFKGIFIQDLRLLYDHTKVPAYLAFLQHNAESMWALDRRGAVFGLQWNGPFDINDNARQVSAVDLLNAQLNLPGQHAAPPAAQAPEATPAP